MLRAHQDDILTIVMIPFRTIVGQIIHINMEKPAGQNDILVTTLVAGTQAEIDLHALEWRLPVSADDINDHPGRILSSSLFEEAGHELHQLPEKLNVNGGREHCQGRSRLPFITMLAILAHSY
jgi:hypothetical protein